MTPSFQFGCSCYKNQTICSVCNIYSFFTLIVKIINFNTLSKQPLFSIAQNINELDISTVSLHLFKMPNYSALIKELESSKTFKKLQNRDFSVDTSISTRVPPLPPRPTKPTSCPPPLRPPPRRRASSQPLHFAPSALAVQQFRKMSAGSDIHKTVHDEETEERYLSLHVIISHALSNFSHSVSTHFNEILTKITEVLGKKSEPRS